MLNKKDAILIATTIAKAAKFDIDNYGGHEETPAIRGATFRALDDLYYDVLPMKVRDQFMTLGKTGHENFLDIARNILN